MSIKFNVIIQKEENWYVAKCLENNIASQGVSIEEALINLREALELYYENEPIEKEPTQTLLTTLDLEVAI